MSYKVTLSLHVSEHHLIKVVLYCVQLTNTCDQIYCVKYYFKRLNNELVNLKKKYVLSTGDMEVTSSHLISHRVIITYFLSKYFAEHEYSNTTVLSNNMIHKTLEIYCAHEYRPYIATGQSITL